MRFEIYSENSGNVVRTIEAETETAASICRDSVIAEMKSQCLLGNDRLLLRLHPEDQQIAMYGVTEAQMVAQAERERVATDSDMTMYAMSILSDAQEMMAIDPNVSRQFINKAKYFISEVHCKLRGEGK
jgi:hypothetical protein